MRWFAVCALLGMVGCFSESDVGDSGGTESSGATASSSTVTSSSTTQAQTTTSTDPSASSTTDPDTGPASEEASTAAESTTTGFVSTGEVGTDTSADAESTGPQIMCPPGECASCVMCAFQGPCMAEHVACTKDQGPCPEILSCAMTCLGEPDPADCLDNTCVCAQSDLAHALVACVVEECPTSCPMFEC